MYYEYDKSFISDSYFDEISHQLVKLQCVNIRFIENNKRRRKQNEKWTIRRTNQKQSRFLC